MARQFPPSFYRIAAGEVPARPPLDGSRRADVCVVGGGFTGLSAALHLAEAGADVVLVESGRIADGASGRSGGQIHSGQRQDVVWLEERFGFEKAKALWDMAEEAKSLVRSLIIRHTIACDLRPGVIEAQHTAKLSPEAERLVEALKTRYGYDLAEFLDKPATDAALGSERYHSAILDRGGGHLDPLRYALGLGRAAEAAGAAIHENSRATELRHDGGPVVVTDRGEIRADAVIVATNGRSGPFETETRQRIIGVNSFIVATEPLGPEGAAILPGGESAADSQFVVRYWRRLADGRLVFGGGESSAGHVPSDIASFVRPHLLKVYPQLAKTQIVHGWGGIVSVTVPRLPFVREIAPAVLAAGGFSGQGVALAPYTGKLLAAAILGKPSGIERYTELEIPKLPTSTWVRRALVTLAIWAGRTRDRLESR
jgi:gamma-glutamylputrescine oxidase